MISSIKFSQQLYNLYVSQNISHCKNIKEEQFFVQNSLIKQCKMFKFSFLINYNIFYPMNKNKTNQNWVDKEITSKRSMGVGENYADPQREVVHWTAVYFEGKFYLSDPHTILKLQQIQADIEFQKKIACQYNSQQYQKAESQRQKGLNLNKSSYSCATEKTPQQLKKNQIKAEQELHKQQEIYHKNLVEFRNKRKNEEKKKFTKNIVKVHQQESKSHKQVKGEIKLNNLKQTIQSKQQSLKQNIFNSQLKQEKGEHNILDMTEEQQIKLNHLFLKKTGQNNHLVINPSSHPQQIYKSQQVGSKNERIQESKSKQREMSKNYIIPKEMEQSLIINKLMSFQNEIIKKLDYEENSKAHQYQKGNSFKNQTFQQRAGNSFFKDINSQIYKLQHNIEKGENGFQTKKQQIESHTISHTHENKQVKESIVIRNHKIQSKNHNQQRKNITVIQLQKEEKSKENNKNGQKLQKEMSNNQQIKQQILPKDEESTHIRVQTKQIPQKRKLNVMPSILNYHISETKQKTEIQGKSQQKQKYQKQINLLQQVIGQLRVQRLKYNVSQNSMHGFRVGEHSQTVLSSFQQIQRDPNFHGPDNNTRLTTPLGYNSLNNFAESSVTQITNSPQKNSVMIKSKSGKIIKNYPKQQVMPKIQEEVAGQVLDRIVSEEKHPNSIINHQKTIKTEHQNFEKAQKCQQIKKNNQNKQKKIQGNLQSVKNISKEKNNQKTTEKNEKLLKQHNSKDKRQSNIKIKIIASNQCHKKSQSMSKNMEKSNAATLQIPNSNKIQKNEIDQESQLPRPLPNRHSHSIPKKINIPNQQHVKGRSDVKKQLIEKFQQAQLAQANIQVVKPTILDPKRRASREGIIKNIETKISVNPRLNNVIKDSASNIKKTICQGEQTKKVKPQEMASKQRNDSKSIQNFRMRKQSQSFRNSRASSHNNNHSSKSCDNTKYNRVTKDSMIYVPALNQKSFYNSRTVQYNEKLIEVGFQARQIDHQINQETIQLQKRAISFSNVQIPHFPNPPDSNISIQDIILLIKKVGHQLLMQFKDSDLHQLLMKKYKNCIMLDLPSSNHLKLVWHYNGRLYIGEWNQTTTMKSGEGIQYIPDKYFYKGQFLNNKRNGNGIMILQNGSKYEGQWQQGEKSGRGKYYDKSLGLYYEGEWKDGKREGFGYFQVEGQSIYEGTFSTNYRFGFGIQKFTNGDCYKGQYQLGKFHGKGIYVWASGSSYEGFFVKGLKEGEGKWQSGTGQSYIGQYLQDKKHGKGCYKWQNGCIFQGQFASDKKNGYGVLKYSNGRQVKGLWQEGQLIEPILAPQDEREKPLNKRSGRNYQTMTLIKTGDSKPKRFSSSSKITNF